MDFPNVGAWWGSRGKPLPLWTLGLEPGLSIPHVTRRRMPEVLRAGTLCAKNNHDVCSAGRCHYSSITSKAWTLGEFAFSSSCGLLGTSPHLLGRGEVTEIRDSLSFQPKSWPSHLLAVSQFSRRVSISLYVSCGSWHWGWLFWKLMHWMPVKCMVGRI